MSRRTRSTHVTLLDLPGRAYEMRYWCPKANRRIRRSTGTVDLKEARQIAKRREAELMTGTYAGDNDVQWQWFREQYQDQELSQLRPRAAEHAETALNAAAIILNLNFLSDLASTASLTRLRNGLASGKGGRFKRPRSPHTVKSYMTDVMTALGFAKRNGWIASIPEISKDRRTKKKKTMKGRPITPEEFDSMLKATEAEVGVDAAESWQYLLRGLWESTLRLEEAMNLSWDRRDSICPVWVDGKSPVLRIPAHQQKNNEDDDLPMLPGLETLLLQTPPAKRRGRVFNPKSLQTRWGRAVKFKRASAAWAGKVISRIGERAKVVVEPANKKLKLPAKFASAHDLRRSCEDRLEQAGLNPLLIARLMRHKSFETTMRHYRRIDTQRDAAKIRALLSPNMVAHVVANKNLSDMQMT